MTKTKAVASIPRRRQADLAPAVAVAADAIVRKAARIHVSLRMTETQAALLDQMKARGLRMGLAPKKGDLLNAGLQLLNRLSEAEFEAVIRPLLVAPKFKKNAKGNKGASAVRTDA